MKYLALLLLLIACSPKTSTPESPPDIFRPDERYFEDPNFCLKDSDCVTLTSCRNENEPRNKFYDNANDPEYDPSKKCEPGQNAYAGNDVKCDKDVCEYRRCYPLWSIESSEELTASQYYAAQCTRNTDEAVCEAVDVFDAGKRFFGKADGIFDCEWK